MYKNILIQIFLAYLLVVLFYISVTGSEIQAVRRQLKKYKYPSLLDFLDYFRS